MSNIKGFSLVELMVAVGIVGVMSSVAVPKYQKYKVNATRAEAQSSLSSMYTLQQLYYTENDQYGKFDGTTATQGPNNQISFPVNNNSKYNYKAEPYSKIDGSATDPNFGNVFFKATAESKKVLGSCVSAGVKDKWCINHDKVLINDKNAAVDPCKAIDLDNGGCWESVKITKNNILEK